MTELPAPLLQSQSVDRLWTYSADEMFHLSDSVFISHQLAGSNPERLDGRQQCYRCTTVSPTLSCCSVAEVSLDRCDDCCLCCSFHRNVCVESEDEASQSSYEC